jgi:stage V sporulation protein R
VKERLLSQLTNLGNPFIYVDNANFDNRGELLLHHEHRGVDLRPDYSKEAMRAIHRLWKRPVVLRTVSDSKPVLLRYDGKELTTQDA